MIHSNNHEMTKHSHTNLYFNKYRQDIRSEMMKTNFYTNWIRLMWTNMVILARETKKTVQTSKTYWKSENQNVFTSL